MLTLAVLASAAFGAGVLNAIAGGGSFLTFPALVFAGIPPIAANATSALAVSPGYLGSTLGFKPELKALPKRLLTQELMVAAFGGVAGALLLLVTPASVFASVVPWLLLFATVLFALGPALAKLRPQATDGTQVTALSGTRLVGLLAVCVYGGYFNGGLGILLMAMYGLVGESRLNTTNALKNVNSLVLSLLSVAAFVWAGVIAWPEGLLMMACATVGGFMGAKWAKRMPTQWVRALVIATGVVMTMVFFARA
ncbi:sulfite exporter TauE/SafE family protein [Comamonadaceae bacterium M7527]|nr:sulfite exporter TauE/SafE family protein [Comamonadaceae bacterium M7527]